MPPPYVVRPRVAAGELGCYRLISAFEDTSLSPSGALSARRESNPISQNRTLIRTGPQARQPDANDSVLYHSLSGWASGERVGTSCPKWCFAQLPSASEIGKRK